MQKLNQPNNHFNKKFNDFYEENYIKVVNPEFNDWFYKDSEIVGDSFDMNGLIQLKNDQNKRRKEKVDVITYDTIQTRNQSSHQSTELFDNDSSMSSYISSSGTHGKLMFDDIRRVHRDETVFTVDNLLYNDTPMSIKELETIRNETIVPLDENKSFHILEQTEKYRREIYNERLVQSINKSNNNEKVSKTFLSRFLNIMG